jgi:hypothetical protein
VTASVSAASVSTAPSASSVSLPPPMSGAASAVPPSLRLPVSSSVQSLFSDNEIDLLPPLLEVVDNIVQEEEEDDEDEDDEEDEMEDAFMDPIDVSSMSSSSTSKHSRPSSNALDNESSLSSIEERLDRAVSEGQDRALSDFGAIARVDNSGGSTSASLLPPVLRDHQLPSSSSGGGPRLQQQHSRDSDVVHLASSLASDLADLVQSMNLGGGSSGGPSVFSHSGGDASSRSSRRSNANADQATPPPPMKRLFSSSSDSGANANSPAPSSSHGGKKSAGSAFMSSKLLDFADLGSGSSGAGGELSLNTFNQALASVAAASSTGNALSQSDADAYDQRVYQLLGEEADRSSRRANPLPPQEPSSSSGNMSSSEPNLTASEASAVSLLETFAAVARRRSGAASQQPPTSGGSALPATAAAASAAQESTNSVNNSRNQAVSSSAGCVSASAAAAAAGLFGPGTTKSVSSLVRLALSSNFPSGLLNAAQSYPTLSGAASTTAGAGEPASNVHLSDSDQVCYQMGSTKLAYF